MSLQALHRPGAIGYSEESIKEMNPALPKKDTVNNSRKRGVKVCIKTFGCQMNVYDSEIMAGLLINEGYKITEDVSEADVILLNTCSIRKKAEDKVYSQLGVLRKLKEKRPGLILGVGGCMAQREGEKIFRKSPSVDLIFGAHQICHLPTILTKVIRERRKVIAIEEERIDQEEVRAYRADKTKAYVAIMRGCDNHCTYCVVPSARGRQRSRSPEEIMKEIENLAEEGYKEITLLGQNVTAYGKDLGEIDFTDLIERVNKIAGVEKIEYITSHPRDMSNRLIETLPRLSKTYEHLHLPIQSGSNRILKDMNRGYTREEYLKIIDKIRSLIPKISITTDIIVGFPGEKEEDFQDTLELMKEIKFNSAYMFQYSPRPGTPAEKMPSQIPEEIKLERLHKVIDLQRAISK